MALLTSMVPKRRRIDVPVLKMLKLLTMGVDGSWREMVLTSPAGFAGLASLLEDKL